MRPLRRGIGLSRVCRRVDSNEPSRHDGTPAMSNQCQLNFPARLLSPDSRRVSTPGVHGVQWSTCGCGGESRWPLRIHSPACERIMADESGETIGPNREVACVELVFYQRFASRWPNSTKESETMVKLLVRDAILYREHVRGVAVK